MPQPPANRSVPVNPPAAVGHSTPTSSYVRPSSKKASRQRGVCVNHLNRCKTSTLIGGIAFPYQVLCHEYFTRRLSNILFICRGARPSVTTLPNEAVSLKGKQLRTLSCVPAWLKLLTSVLFMRCLFSVPLSTFSKRFFDFIFGARPYWIFPDVTFAQFLTSNHSTIPVRFNWSVFCTCDAFHISNSIRYFWASVNMRDKTRAIYFKAVLVLDFFAARMPWKSERWSLRTSERSSGAVACQRGRALGCRFSEWHILCDSKLSGKFQEKEKLFKEGGLKNLGNLGFHCDIMF